MKKISLFLVIALALSQITKAQVTMTVACDLMSLTVNISDTNIVDIYHPGHYLTHPQEYNVIDWKITDTQGNIIAQETIIDYNRFNFQPNIPLSDTLNVIAHLVNDSAIFEGNRVNCLIQDQLYWKEYYYSTGTLYGRWTFVHDNVGVDQNGSIDSCIAIPLDDCFAIDIWDPVCGCDGVTYSNSAYAACNSIYDYTDEECNSQGGICISNSGIQIIEIGFWENPNDPCEMGECTPNGDFIEIVVDCMGEMGMPCNGEWVQVDGQCCSECLETTFGCEYEDVLYDFGSSMAQDCNSCYCQVAFNPNANGIWICTEMDCGCEPIYIIITSGWNMIGFACAQDTDAEEAFADILDKIIIVKDAVGNAYLPDFGFNGIGDLERGYGYLIKVSEEVINYNICD